MTEQVMETLKSKLDKLRDRVEGGMSAKFLKIMHRATQDLEATGILNGVLPIGAEAPTISLNDQQGNARHSEQLLESGPLVLTFYRGFWCPYCNADLAHLQQYVDEIKSLGATLLAVSPEKPEYSRKIISTQKLSFDILFDEQNELAAKFGLRYALPEDLRTLYRDSFNINLKLYHGDNDWTLPLPARFVIDQTGTIRYSESNVDYRSRPEVDGVLDTLRKMT
jgi:peroxiredoxin